jgi:hypothetical protein
MHDAIVREITRFEWTYTPSTPETTVWAHQLHKRVRAHLAYLRRGPSARPPRHRLDAPVLLDVDDIERARSSLEASKRQLTRDEFETKCERWRRMWARVYGLIAAFQVEQQNAIDDDRDLADEIMLQTRDIVATHRLDLEGTHPGMPSIDGIEADKTLYEWLINGTSDDDDNWISKEEYEVVTGDQPS